MDNIPWHIGLLIVVLLLFFNAVCVATEFVMVKVRRSRIEALAEDGSASAKSVLSALGQVDFFIAAGQLGITMATIGLGYVGEPVLARFIEPPVEALVGSFAPALSHTLAVATAFLFATMLHIVFGEFVPKSIALQQAEKTALAIIPGVTVYTRIFGPVIRGMNGIGFALLRLFGMDTRALSESPLAAEDLAYTLESSASAGLISRREMDLARHAIEFERVPASAVMVPRNDVIGLRMDAERHQVLSEMTAHRHTRYPVFREHMDDIVGIVDAKRVLLDIDPDADWRRHIVPAVIMPETAPIADALVQARDHETEMAILVDEYGGVSGLMSFFDAAGFLAGRLPEEQDTSDARIRRNDDGSFSIAGQMRIVEIEESLDLEFPEVDANTIGGLLLAELERVPKVGDEVTVNGFVLRVTAMDRYRIEKLDLIPNGSDAAATEAEVAHGRS